MCGVVDLEGAKIGRSGRCVDRFGHGELVAWPKCQAKGARPIGVDTTSRRIAGDEDWSVTRVQLVDTTRVPGNL